MTCLINNQTIFAQSPNCHFDNVEDSDFHEIENLENYPAMSTNLMAQCRQLKDLAITDQKTLAAELLNEFYKTWGYESFKNRDCIALEDMKNAFQNLDISILISSLGISNTFTLFVRSYQFLFLLSQLGEDDTRQKFREIGDLFKNKLFSLKKSYPDEWNKQDFNRLQLNNVFPQSIFSKNIKSESTVKKVLKIALPVFLVASCVLQQNNITLLIERTFCAFRGDEGWAMPTLMISAYLALKYIIFLNQKSNDQEISITSRVFSWLKKVPTNFAIGVSKLPQSLILGINTAIIAELIFKSLSINASNFDLEGEMNRTSMFNLVVKYPFLEELFFREFVQGSLISTMKLINLVGFRMGKGVIITDETTNISSRIFSTATFGLLHANQSLIQAAVAGVNSYCYETWLYEKNGLFASFGLHFANNFVAYLIQK